MNVPLAVSADIKALDSVIVDMACFCVDASDPPSILITIGKTNKPTTRPVIAPSIKFLLNKDPDAAGTLGACRLRSGLNSVPSSGFVFGERFNNFAMKLFGAAAAAKAGAAKCGAC